VKYAIFFSGPPMPNSKRSRLWLVGGLVLFLVAFSLFTTFGQYGLVDLWRLSGERKRLSEKNFSLHRENEALREKINKLRHDDRYLEKMAREELGFVGPGEIVYQFATRDSREETGQAVKEDRPRPLLSWGRREHP